MVVVIDKPHSYNRKECREWGSMSMGAKSNSPYGGITPGKKDEFITLRRLFY